MPPHTNLGGGVYIVGTQLDGTIPKAQLWITDTSGSTIKPIALSNKENSPSAASSLTTTANQLFCVGGQQDATSYKATLWITNTRGSFVKKISLDNPGTNGSFAQSIIAVGNRLFCSGIQYSAPTRATLWITDTSGFSIDLLRN